MQTIVNLSLQKHNFSVQVQYTFEPPCLYQDYVESSSYLAPDIVAALDCGFKWYPTWDKCIPKLMPRAGVPLVFTEFNLQVRHFSLNEQEPAD